MTPSIPDGPVGEDEYPVPIWIEVTPHLADTWLSGSIRNRHRSERHAGGIKRDMLTNRFDGLNSETVKFTWRDGRWRLFDGQHRLEGVTESGVTIPLLCVFGAHVLGVDKVRPRTFADQKRIDGTPQANQLAAVTRLVTIWLATGAPVRSSKMAPTDAELDETLNRHPCIEETITLADRLRRAGSIKASVGGWLRFATAHANGHECRSPDDDWFIERLIEGDGLKRGHPALTLRKRAIEDKQFRGDDLRLAAGCVYAWNAYREGREMFIIQIPGTLTSATFPAVR